jgi:hypothetical protein
MLAFQPVSPLPGSGTPDALTVGVLTRFAATDTRSAKPRRTWLRGLSLLACLAGTLFSGAAFADSRGSLVFVSVQVVDSCRVNTSQSGLGVDVNMRCTSAARPSVRMESPVGPAISDAGLTGSKPISSLSLARTGDQVLRIDF